MHLAQLNIGHAIDRIDSPALADFAARIDEINALADQALGFVWRHKSEAGYEDGGDLWGPDYLVNLSVWKDMESLKAYIYHSDHRELVAARRQWFKKMDTPFFVAWWIDEDHTPTLKEAKARLDHLVEHGPSQHAFDMHTLFPPPA